jgi:hypothetical protein
MRVLAACLVALLVAGCADAQPAQPSAAEADTAAAPTDEHLQGTYRLYVDFWKRTENGLPVPQEPRNEVYAFRTQCRQGDVCVATTAQLDLADPTRLADKAATATLDYAHGMWQMTSEVSITCADQDTRALESWTLQRRDDGSFAGTYRLGSAAPGCGAAVEAPLTLTWLGATSPSVQFADPAKEESLTRSAGAGFAGRYRSTTTDPDTGGQESQELLASTTCVRNTDRCLAFLTRDTLVEAYELSGDTWTSNRRAVTKCPTGAAITATANNELAMPSPPTDPIGELRGTHTVVFPDPCPATGAFTLFLQRVGD